MTAKPVRSDSIALDDMNGGSNLSTNNDLQRFMHKYEELDKDRRKYIICFFALFGLVIICLVIILVGLTAGSNSQSNIDTCHTQNECAVSSNNDFVTLTESDTDKPIATLDGFLTVELKDTNLTNYSRWIANNGQVIKDINIDSYFMSIHQNLSIHYNNTAGISISIERDIYRGNVPYSILRKACDILFTGTTSDIYKCLCHIIYI